MSAARRTDCPWTRKAVGKKGDGTRRTGWPIETDRQFGTLRTRKSFLLFGRIARNQRFRSGAGDVRPVARLRLSLPSRVLDPVGLLLATTSGRHRRRGLVPNEFLVIEASLDGGLDGLKIRRQIEIPRREETVMAEI